MTQDPGATPSTPPMQALPPLDDATRVRPDSTGGAGTQQLDPPAQHSPARGSLRFYAGVSCGSILLALVIGIGGFLGLRGLGEESATAPVATAESGAGEGGTDSAEAPESGADAGAEADRSEEHTSELQSRGHLVCRLLLEKKNE